MLQTAFAPPYQTLPSSSKLHHGIATLPPCAFLFTLLAPRPFPTATALAVPGLPSPPSPVPAPPWVPALQMHIDYLRVALSHFYHFCLFSFLCFAFASHSFPLPLTLSLVYVSPLLSIRSFHQSPICTFSSSALHSPCLLSPDPLSLRLPLMLTSRLLSPSSCIFIWLVGTFQVLRKIRCYPGP